MGAASDASRRLDRLQATIAARVSYEQAPDDPAWVTGPYAAEIARHLGEAMRQADATGQDLVAVCMADARLVELFDLDAGRSTVGHNGWAQLLGTDRG